MNKPCLICNKEFKTWPCLVKRGGGLFCSRVCRGAHQTIMGIKHYNCKVCNKEVLVSGSRKTKNFPNKFCSQACMGIFFRTPTYNPDKNKAERTSQKYLVWRKQVFNRDNYTCQMCGERGGRLCADHIKPFAHYPELRTELSNGRTLCVDCHKLTPTYGGRRYTQV